MNSWASFPGFEVAWLPPSQQEQVPREPPTIPGQPRRKACFPLQPQCHTHLLSICNLGQERLLTSWLQTTCHLPGLKGGCLGVIPPFVQEVEEVESLSEQARLGLCLPPSAVVPLLIWGLVTWRRHTLCVRMSHAASEGSVSPSLVRMIRNT